MFAVTYSDHDFMVEIKQQLLKLEELPQLHRHAGTHFLLKDGKTHNTHISQVA